VKSDEWVLAEFYSEPQAKAARALLKSAAIPSLLKGMVTAIQLMTPPSFLEQAHQLLDSRISEEDLMAEAMASPSESSLGEDADDDSIRGGKISLPGPWPGTHI
jgi:hypothetical protein